MASAKSVNDMTLLIGHTPLVELVKIGPFPNNNRVFVKVEGNNPAGSVKDRPALSMIEAAEERGELKKGDTLIEATSGNTGIALAAVAAMKGYKMKLIMPSNMTVERRATMAGYGAEIIDAPGMDEARDMALEMQKQGKGRVLDQFANEDNWKAHYRTTGPEIWEGTDGKVTHFCSIMGTTGTAMGVGRYLREKNPSAQIYGFEPAEGSSIPGTRKWPKAYIPKIFDRSVLTDVQDIEQTDAISMTKKLAEKEGMFVGISAGANVAGAVRLANDPSVHDAVIVTIACDRGDRYLSTGIFNP
eukprot:GCRY01000344.1.p1 GENE.GCRY01000344.1~~GCRY01000344.1.p1  ORF type:complete len:301 (-),score=71.50 GCRY01000344.1:132-1034(-)